MRNCEQEIAPYFSVLLYRFSCNCYHHIISSVITTFVNPFTLHSDSVSPLEAHSRGYDDDDDDDDDDDVERHTKQFPRTRAEHYVLKLCGIFEVFWHEEKSD